VIKTSFTYTNGPLGRFYQAMTNLVDQGSRSAADAGLFHHTVQASLAQEAASTVDIGFHYLATDANGVPADSDGDGLSDISEDPNNNGTVDTGETDWNNPDTDYDGRSDGQELLVDGTDALSADSVVSNRLCCFSFNDTNWFGTNISSLLSSPMTATNVQNVDAWITKALQVTNNTAKIQYRDVEANGAANINLRYGTIRFWFKPNWTSDGGGGGTGTQARLIQVGTNGDTTNGWWSCYYNTNATNIIFESKTNNTGGVNLTATNIFLVSNSWYQIVLIYTPTNCALYTNGVLAQTNTGTFYYPGLVVRTNGWSIGSDLSGTNQAKGIFEDLETFNYPLGTNDIVSNYEATKPPSNIPGLKLWLKADVGIETNDAYGRISRWLDQSGNTNNANQALQTKQSSIVDSSVNGRPIIRFDGTNQFLSLTNFQGSTYTQAEIFILHKSSRSAGLTNGFCNFGGNIDSRYPNSDGNILDNFGYSDNNNPYKTGIPMQDLTQYHLYNVTSTSNEWTSRINGLVHYTLGTNSLSFPSSGETIGKSVNVSGPFFAGDIAEMLIYNRKLSDAERNAVGVYLNARYAFVTNAPEMPTNLLASAVSSNQVSLTWNATNANSSVTYLVERKLGAGDFSRVGYAIDATSYFDADTSLLATSNYTYRVYASNYFGASAYTPTNASATTTTNILLPLSEIKTWLRADAGIVRQTTNKTVGLWLSQTTNYVINATNILQVAQPSLILNALNARPAIEFNGTSNRFQFTQSAFTNLTQAEIFVVVKSTVTGNGLWEWGTSYTQYPNTNNVIIDSFGWSKSPTVTFCTLTTLTNFNLYNVSAITNDWTGRINNASGICSGNSTNYGVYFGTTVYLGYGAGATYPYFTGDIAEMLLFKSVLSSGQRTTVENYFYNKYNISH